MYINFWYPIARSEDLGYDQPEKVKVLGVNLVAFRDQDGKPRVLSDTCVHRGGSLGGAWSGLTSPRIVNGCVVCPYHGWEFGGDGRMQEYPVAWIRYEAAAPGQGRFLSGAGRSTASCSHSWVTLSADERPPLLNVEEYGQEGWRANTILILDVAYNYERSMENGLDPAHNEFVHPTHGFSGINRETYRVRDYDTEDHRQGWGFWFTHRFDAPPLPQADHPTAQGSTPWGETKTERSEVYASSGTYGPNTMSTYINLTSEQMFRQYFFEQPVDENHTRIFFLNMRNFMLGPSKDGPIHARNKIIAKQDIDILLGLYPEQTPLGNTKEVLMPADKAIVTYREWLEKFDNQGWRINIGEFNRRNGKNTAFAIPCPARRESGHWVLDAIPTIESRAEREIIENAA